LFTCTPSPRTLSPATSRTRSVKELVRSPQAIPPPRLTPSYPEARHASGKDASPRHLQPTFDTSTLRAARFPVAPPTPLPCESSALCAGPPSANDLRRAHGWSFA
jgi:hypothetical protein